MIHHANLILRFVAITSLLFSCNPQPKQTEQTTSSDSTQSTFKGVIKLDVRDSKADWAPFIRKKAPEGSPNILIVLYDDTGLGAWSPYGGRISMPTMDKLAAEGITYTQWHTVALCSPTRSCINTGRNHTLNGMGSITEGANGFPGYSAMLPPQTATMAQILNDNGWSTFW